MPPPGRKVPVTTKTQTVATSPQKTARPTGRPLGKYLSKATSIVQPRASFIILLGAPGMGKSSLAAQWPNPVFMVDSMERGIEPLIERSLVPANVNLIPPINNWDEALACLREIASVDHGYQTLVIEGIGGFQKYCFQHCCAADYKGNFSGIGDGFYSYYSGPKVAGKRHFTEFSDRIEAVRDRGIHVILTGHTNVKSKGNPGGADYMAEIVDCEIEVWNSIHRAADAILVIADQYNIDAKGIKAKLKSTGHNRVLQCVAGGMYGGKNRWNLHEPIETGGSAEETYLNLSEAAQFDPRTAFYTP